MRSVPLNFRVWPGVKDAIDAMVAQRAAVTGDDSITGWFLAMVHREARRADIAIASATEAKPAKRKAPVKARAPKRKAR